MFVVACLNLSGTVAHSPHILRTLRSSSVRDARKATDETPLSIETPRCNEHRHRPRSHRTETDRIGDNGPWPYATVPVRHT